MRIRGQQDSLCARPGLAHTEPILDRLSRGLLELLRRLYGKQEWDDFEYSIGR